MNITNIDDKIISKQTIARSWKMIAEKYEAEFWEDLNSLNVRHPDIKLRVTDKIPEIIKFIEHIEKQGFTKSSDDGSVYFKTSNYKNYGKLQNVVIDGPSSADFALWKGAKPNEPAWETKWGKGRPGWHIECSTLASLVFGSHLDFHAGGIDLRFPHHENEEAQSCVFHAVPNWVENWIHTGHLHTKGQAEKMSKSLKNTVSIRQLLQEHSSDQFRVACLLSHYRSSIEFGPELMIAAEAILKKSQSFRDDVRAYVAGVKGCGEVEIDVLMNAFEDCKRGVDAALRDDFNTSKSISYISDFMNTTSKMINNLQSDQQQTTTCGSDKAVVQGIVNYIDELFKTLGVGEEKLSHDSADNLLTENLVSSLVKTRNEIRMRAKAEKNQELFKVCDMIRDTFKENGIEIKDHGNLSSWNKV